MDPSNTFLQTPKATRREWIGLSVLAIACVLYAMDLTVLHLAVPRISADLQPSSAQLLWIIDIYGFMVAGLLITMGTLGDRIGRRKILLIGAAAFGATSVLAALSITAEMLIAARALMGVAGATLAPSTLSLIFSMFRDPKQRSIAVGIWITGFSSGAAIGPVLGGLMLEFFWWGSVFLMALPVMALLLVLGPRVLPEFQDPDAGRLDPLSAGMSLVAILAIIYGLKVMAQDGPGLIPALSVFVGLGVGILFAVRQLKLSDPLIDIHLFRMPSFSASLTVNVLSVFVAFGYFLFVAQYLQLVLQMTPLEAGLWSLPAAIGFIVGSNVAPRIIPHVRPAFLLGTCLIVAALGLGILTQVGGPNGLAIVVAASLVISVMLAPVFSLTTELIVGSAPPERAGAASGISETAAELGGAVGIAILGSIGVAIYRNGLATGLPPEFPYWAASVASDTLGAALDVAQQLPDGQGSILLKVARDAFVQGMQVTSAIAAVVSIGLATLALVMLRHMPPISQGQTEQSIDERASGAEPAATLITPEDDRV